jgi:hypothetical protein
LGTLDTYGGSTQAFPLLPGSAAIDSGDDATCTATDQRGISRLQGTHCDMGAFESRGFTLAITSGNNQSTFTNFPFVQPLALRVNSSYGEPVNGGVVSLTPPASGASANLSKALVTIENSVVSVNATANGTAGSYDVTASTAGIYTPVTFHLSNILGFRVYLPLIIR